VALLRDKDVFQIVIFENGGRPSSLLSFAAHDGW
jgi:hypothetical protein